MKVEKTCPVCETQFETRVGRKEKTVCSRSCSNAFFKKRRQTAEACAKRSSSMTGVKRPWMYHEISKPCPICMAPIVGTQSRVKRRKTCGQKSCVSVQLSRMLIGETGGPRQGGGRGKQTLYGGVVWDSTWEARLAKRLDELAITWIRPGKDLSIPYEDLNGRSRNYYPDFFLPAQNAFVEVKGYWSLDSRHRVEQAQQKHRIIILDSLKLIDTFTGV